MSRTRGKRANRSGPARYVNAEWYREQTTRKIGEPITRETDTRIVWVERELETMRKNVIIIGAKDQRLSGVKAAWQRAYKKWTARLAWHLTEHHGITIETRREYGYTDHTRDGKHIGGYEMDDLHEKAHGRAA